ncbi:uncharacterized protein NEMAJ01_1848 [Nematocida major]|uniref:uncharacterized protein n=1 Tax=Nematocida major TaxID=1912982 RepID=UPI002007A004|nr:uncharacterized protein NEMAJ01_1848 [Nematocida major]KAH9386952.1 hypothetical protein NEMAJ01_1848 [Nematocida major]
MCAQQTCNENRNSNDDRFDVKSFRSKILSRKGRGLVDERWLEAHVVESAEVLVLDENQLSLLPPGALRKYFPRLKILSLRGCSLERLSIEAISHPTLEIIDVEGNVGLTSLSVWEGSPKEGAALEGLPSLQVLNLLGTSIMHIDPGFFEYTQNLRRLNMHVESVCGGCGFGFLGMLEFLECLKFTGVRTGSCSICKTEMHTAGFSTVIKYSIYNMVCKMASLIELDLSGRSMNIDYFIFHAPLPELATLRLQGKLVRDMSLRDWPGIIKTIRHLSLGVLDDSEDASGQKAYSESTFYTEKILEATNLESLSFDCETTRRIKFSLGTKKVVFPHLRHLTIKNCDLRPLTFFNKENAPALDSLEIVSVSFTEGYFYTIKKRLGNRLRSLRIGIEKMDAPQAIYDLFTFIRSHKNMEILHLAVCETITESQSFYKYFSDQPALKELYVIGQMSVQRMKRFLYQLGRCETLKSLLLDIEDPALVLTYFCPIRTLEFFSLKGTYRNHSNFHTKLGTDEEAFGKIGEMPALQVLDMGHCGLSGFPPSVLAKFSDLKYLYLNNNNMHDIPDQTVSYLASFKEKPLFVDISDNPTDVHKIEKTVCNETWLGVSGFVMY